MASSAPSVANSGQPFYMCRKCRTQICFVETLVLENGNKYDVPSKEMNVKVVAGANEWKIEDKYTYVDVSCPECGLEVGYKMIAKKDGDRMVAKEGEVELYMSCVLLRDGNTTYERNWVVREIQTRL